MIDMNIASNIAKIKASIPAGVELVAVSKTKPASMIEEAYEAGQRVFGENRAQELAEKHQLLPKDIEWHMIGHMQSNKVKYIAEFVELIHSVDSLKLLREINHRAAQHGRVIGCLLQFHIAQESTKFGYDLEEAHELLNSEEFQSMENVQIQGVMGMATFTDNAEQVRSEFKTLSQIFNDLKGAHFADAEHFETISMGMSGDYALAIEEGSNMVRIGSTIFGSR
jgi:pyridoxal phosphate enzyme (YggS family)